jgi:hypothetical protein
VGATAGDKSKGHLLSPEEVILPRLMNFKLHPSPATMMFRATQQYAQVIPSSSDTRSASNCASEDFGYDDDLWTRPRASLRSTFSSL